jgi:hypothetical protein
MVALVGIAGCFAAVAYGAAPRDHGGAASDPQRNSGGSLPKPSITRHPDKPATSANAGFGFSARGRNPRFQCRLDDRAWSACRTPVAVGKLTAGRHSFFVRTVGVGGRHSRAARFRWRVLEPKDFSIVPQLSGLDALYPGAPPVALPLTIANPNPVPILITSLRASATADPQGCASAENLALIESSASSSAPIKVPAGGSVTLPAPGTSPPAIQLRDLPRNQDACQNARFPLAFFGKASG